MTTKSTTTKAAKAASTTSPKNVKSTWTKGATPAKVTAARKALADAGVSTDTLVTVAKAEQAVEGVAAHMATLKASQRNAWLLVAVTFDGTLPTKGAGSREVQAARAGLVTPLTEAGWSADAARKAIQRYRWRGLIALRFPGKSDADVLALASDEAKAAQVVASGEWPTSGQVRKPRPASTKAPKTSTKTSTSSKPPTSAKALSGALVASPKSVAADERNRLDRKAVAWLIQSAPAGIDTKPLAAWLEAQAKADAQADAQAAGL